jgi:DNA mismatch repair protein MutL
MIRILPDHIANRIAAGEVVQRPASAVKELMENALDAGADKITLMIEDAGRTLIQVIDNGCGMAPEEAQIAFERHATSKIQEAEDLESIETFGFRGEALAAIAAVSHVTLKTRQLRDELGFQVHIQGSRYLSEQAVSCAPGSSIEVRNLFYNVPARRKFLKSDAVECKHIAAEFTHIAICSPQVELRLIQDGKEAYHLLPSKIKPRLARLLGREMEKELVDIGTKTSFIRIWGYIGKPSSARKSAGHQFFFINGRFFKSSYFQRAVLNAYEHLIPEKSYPSWCIFMETDPCEIDVNIHPAKTEIKIENESMVFQVLQSAVREALGKNALGPSIDFDTEGVPSIPPLKKGLFSPPPKINFDPLFNPFDHDDFDKQGPFSPPSSPSSRPLVYEQTPEFFTPAEQESLPQRQFLSLKGKYLLTPVKSGLMLVHLKRAQERIRYEHYIQLLSLHKPDCQQSLYPQDFSLSATAVALLEENREALCQMGFDIRCLDGENVRVYGLPVGYSTETEDVAAQLDQIVYQLENHNQAIEGPPGHSLALGLACAESRSFTLAPQAAAAFVDKLFACSQPNLSPSGACCMHIMSIEEMDKMLDF